MLTVEKIGGTSMSRFEDVLKNIIFSPSRKGRFYDRVFVISAYAGVTDMLLEHKKTGVPGIYARFAGKADYNAALDELLDRLLEINRGFEGLKLDLRRAETFLRERIERVRGCLESMTEVLASGYVDRQNILLAAREVLASVGESHAAFNTADIIRKHGVDSTFVDLGGFHDVEYLTINERIHKALEGIDFSKTVAVVTGYTKGTEGIMREFDRGYSEVTFSKVAVEVKAAEAVIHKEYHLSSADPAIVGVEHSVPVGFTNFDVADQLADIGMEAIHPKASKPLEIAGINIRIKNTFQPEHPGTLISKGYAGRQSRVEIIAGTDKVEIIEVHDPSMVGQVGFDRDIMQLFYEHRTSYIVKATNANSISIVIWDREKNAVLIRELEGRYEKVTVKKAAVVCVIGTNIATPGVLARAAGALAARNINIDVLSQSLRQVNIQFVVGRDSYRDAVVALHAALCEKT
jgi:aspartate kinase